MDQEDRKENLDSLVKQEMMAVGDFLVMKVLEVMLGSLVRQESQVFLDQKVK